MTVNRIEITNIKGVSYCELTLVGRSLTVIKGANGSGKSSILDAISTIFLGGSDPALIRQGEKAGKVLLELSDGITIHKVQRVNGATLEVRTKDGEKINAPMEFVAKLARSFAFDPLAFLRAAKKDRVEFLLKAMPLAFSGEELHVLKQGKLAVAGPLKDMVAADAKLSLPEFDKLRTAVYERRRTANAAVKELDATVANLRKSLPEAGEDGSNPEALKTAQGELDRITRAEQEEITEIHRQVNEAKDQARKAYEAELAGIASGFEEAVQAARNAVAVEKEAIQQRIGALQGALKRSGEVEALKSHLEQQKDRLAARMDEAEALDKALGGMDQLRAAKIKTLPIAGLEIRDGEVYRDGIEFDHLNQARQYVTAVEIGSSQCGELPLVVCDEAEHLDSAQQKAFYGAVEASGMQVIMAVVTDGPLRSEPKEALKL